MSNTGSGRARNCLGLATMLCVATGLLATGCGADHSGTSKETTTGKGGGDILIGAPAAKTGVMAGYDVEPMESMELYFDKVNAQGGIDGRKIKVDWVDTRSDPQRGAAAASDLIAKGARLLTVTGDFDFGSPAAIVGQSKQVPSISVLASDSKFADEKTIGTYAFTVGTGTDAKGSIIAEYAHDVRRWKSTYILQDTSIEYSKSLGKYFAARWKQLGGQVVGEQSYKGTPTVNVSSQVTKLRNVTPRPDFIFIPGWLGGGEATVIKQIRDAGIDTPIFSAAAIDGELLTKVAGKVSDVWLTPYGCFDYCAGQNSTALQRYVDAFEKKYGKPPTTAYAMPGWDLGAIIVAALRRNPDAQGEELVKALEQAKPSDTITGASFSPACHKPSHRPMDIVEVVKGKFTYRATATAKQIPDVGDGNPCAGS